jgi:hypothetical protein
VQETLNVHHKVAIRVTIFPDTCFVESLSPVFIELVLLIMEGEKWVELAEKEYHLPAPMQFNG